MKREVVVHSKRAFAAVSALALALVVLMAGCTGGFSPTLPSPDGEVDVGQSVIASDSQGQLLPEGLTVTNFEVTLDGVPTTVRRVVPSREGGISICFIVDSTGSMQGEIDGVTNSIAAFAAGFTGFSVSWSGIEYGDSTPSDGPNTWDFSFPGGPLHESVRTLVQPSQVLANLQTWLTPIVALGGGDTPENPLKALMEAKSTMSWPSGAVRHFIVLTDVGAHQSIDPPPNPSDYYPRPDNEPFSPYMGSEVLAAFRGWGVIHAISPDLTRAWVPAQARVQSASNDGQVRPRAVDPLGAGWDIRELADGGPEAYRTHNGTGGRWVEMPDGGDVDLTELGIADFIRQSYVIVYTRSPLVTSAHVVITAHYTENSVPKTATFDLGTVTF